MVNLLELSSKVETEKNPGPKPGFSLSLCRRSELIWNEIFDYNQPEIKYLQGAILVSHCKKAT
jgi:hypothetical protein